MSEDSRIAFLERRDGKQAAVAWVARTMRLYRECVLNDGKNSRKWHFASTHDWREKFIRSYLEFKRYYFLNKGNA